MSQKPPVDGFRWVKDLSKLNENFIENYDEKNGKGYILKVDVKYQKNLYKLHVDLPFLLERMKINKCEKLLCTVYDKKTVIHINTLKQVLKYIG